MASIRPAAGWNLDPTRQPQGPPGQPPVPLYAYDLEAAGRRQPFLSDIRNMSGREARQLTFGAVFGAATGFYMARFVVGLLKVGLLLGGIVLLLALVRLGLSTTPHAESVSASPVVRTAAVRRAAGACPGGKIQEGMTLDDVKRELTGYRLVYWKTLQDQEIYHVNSGGCRLILEFNADGRLDAMESAAR